MNLGFVVNGPANVANVLIATWSDIPFSQDEIASMIDIMLEMWRGEDIDDNGPVPFEKSDGHPVEEQIP